MRKQSYTHTWTRALILRASPRDFPWNNLGYPTLCFPAQSLLNCLCAIINVGRFRFACLYQKKSQKCQVSSHISQLLLSDVVQPIALHLECHYFSNLNFIGLFLSRSDEKRPLRSRLEIENVCHEFILKSESPISISLVSLCHVPLTRDHWDWDWRLRLDNTPNTIGCIYVLTKET